jgi:hypothetical protein
MTEVIFSLVSIPIGKSSYVQGRPAKMHILLYMKKIRDTPLQDSSSFVSRYHIFSVVVLKKWFCGILQKSKVALLPTMGSTALQQQTTCM